MGLFLLIFTMLFGSTVFAYGEVIHNKNNLENLIFLKDEKPDRVIIIENWVKYILENKSNGKIFVVRLIDENGNIVVENNGNFGDMDFAFYKSNGS